MDSNDLDQLIYWFVETLQAKELVNGKDETQKWSAGAFDVIVRVIMISTGWMGNSELAAEWLCEEINHWQRHCGTN